MSFSRRLTLFFIGIVALPMIALAVLVGEIADDSETGKLDARLAKGLDVALAIYAQHQDQAGAVASSVAESLDDDREAARALVAGNRGALERFVRERARDQRAVSLAILDADGEELAHSGPPDAVASAEQPLAGEGESPLGTLVASTTTATGYVREVARVTGDDPALVLSSGDVVGPVSVDIAELPPSGEGADVEIGDDELRVAASELPGEQNLRIAMLAPSETEGFFASRPRVAIGLVIFLVIALIAAGLITQALRGQVAEMLGAARRIGSGDFSRKVPVTGRDELAGLANEFNKMSERLTEQMGQLRRQRVEIERSVQRIGDAVASGLDREALLKILVETAVSACEADYGIVVGSGRVGAEAEIGSADDRLHEVALEAERRAVRESELIVEERDGSYALAHSLGSISGGERLGVMAVARAARPFEAADRDVFLYLLGQAAASVENVALHELVSEQAVTDELTGLANNRAFRETMAKESARAERFGHELSLLMLDIDDFKQVNDTYGHPQGDVVLRAIGRILDSESREIDEPARYGGEEFAVALPETGLDGALELAERIRTRIAAEAIPRLDGDGELRVTASVGAATMPGAADGVDGLIAAADGALYEAKRRGKDRVASPTGRTQRGEGKRRQRRRTAQGRRAARRK